MMIVWNKKIFMYSTLLIVFLVSGFAVGWIAADIGRIWFHFSTGMFQTAKTVSIPFCMTLFELLGLRQWFAKYGKD